MNINTVDNRIIKASYTGCSLSDRKIFPQSKCIMPISIGQKFCEGDKFKAVLKLVDRSFASCVILIDDTIQRYSLQIENLSYTDEEAYEYALKLGSEWLDYHQSAIEKLNIPYEILRWDHWLNHQDYREKHQLVESAYNANEHYQNALNTNIAEYIARYRLKHHKIDLDRANTLCLKYLVEECAGMCLWTETKSHFEVYPNGRNPAMAATYNLFIKEHFPELLRSVSIRYKKYPALKAENNISDKLELET